jgi:hypothetical protein
VDVDIGGGACGHAEDLAEVCTIFGREAFGVS